MKSILIRDFFFKFQKIVLIAVIYSTSEQIENPCVSLVFVSVLLSFCSSLMMERDAEDQEEMKEIPLKCPINMEHLKHLWNQLKENFIS